MTLTSYVFYINAFAEGGSFIKTFANLTIVPNCNIEIIQLNK